MISMLLPASPVDLNVVQMDRPVDPVQIRRGVTSHGVCVVEAHVGGRVFVMKTGTRQNSEELYGVLRSVLSLAGEAIRAATQQTDTTGPDRPRKTGNPARGTVPVRE